MADNIEKVLETPEDTDVTSIVRAQGDAPEPWYKKIIRPMPVYAFTLKKYLKQKSTWVITGISSILFAFVLGNWLAFSFVDADDMDGTIYALLIRTFIGMITGFLAIFASVFAGFKAAAMYKDEVEEGTFLVMLSKPVKRGTIIFEKWLALLTVILGYALINVIFYMIGAAIFDVGGDVAGMKDLGVEPLTDNIFVVGMVMFAIIVVTALIFASIALLVSTKLPTSATVGIAIGLGLVIPITGMIGSLTRSTEFQRFTNANFALRQNSINKTYRESGDDAIKLEGVAMGEQMTEIDNIMSDVYHIYDWSGATGDSDGMKGAWIFDLQYQNNAMASLASDPSVPTDVANKIDAIVSEYADRELVTSFDEKDELEDSMKDVLLPLEEVWTEINKPITGANNRSMRDDLAGVLILPGGDLDEFVNDNQITNQNPVYTHSGLIADAATVATSVGTQTYSPDSLALVNTLNNNSGTVQWDMLEAAVREAFTFGDIKDNAGTVLGTVHFSELINENVSSYTDKDLQLRAFVVKYVDALMKGALGTNDDWDDYMTNLDRAFNPLTGIVVSGDVASTFAKDNSVSSAAVSINGGIWGTYDELQQEDQNLVRNLIAISDAGKLSVVETKDYASPLGLLLGYGAIALILVPLTYLIIRRQDFR